MLGKLRGKGLNPEEDLRELLVQAMEVLRETEANINKLPPEARQEARRSFDESVGESLADIPRPELSGLRERMSRLDDHLIQSYLGSMWPTGDRPGRKAMRASARKRADQVEELIKALDRIG